MRKALLIFLIPILLSGCGKTFDFYELVVASGKVFSLNKVTGDVKVVTDEGMLSLGNSKYSESMYATQRSKTWGPYTIIDVPKVTFQLKTKYRNGQMLWRLVAIPNAGEEEKLIKELREGDKKSGHIDFNFLDEDSFPLNSKISIDMRSSSRVVNEKGIFTSLSWEGSEQMALKTYQEGTGFTTSWRGFK